MMDSEDKILFGSSDANLVVSFDTLVGGAHKERVGWVRIMLGGKHAQFERHISVTYLRPRKRKKEGYTLTPDGGAWYCVEADGVVVWDSRTVFPCYATLEEAREKSESRHGLGPGAENDGAIERWNEMVKAANERWNAMSKSAESGS